MGADLIVTVCPLPRMPGLLLLVDPWVRQRISKLSKKRATAICDYRGLDEEEDVVEAAQQWLAAGWEALLPDRDGHYARDVVFFKSTQRWYAIVGGTSYGDEPSENYDSVSALAYSGILNRMPRYNPQGGNPL